MLVTLIAAPLLFMQDPTATMVEQNYERREVAFEELLEGDLESAIAVLETELADNPHEPAVLINLGSAYAQLGDLDRAENYYRAARDCEEGYMLELADGRWIDSRDAARLALASVEFQALAAR